MQGDRGNVQSLQNIKLISFAMVAGSFQLNSVQNLLLLAVDALKMLLLLHQLRIVLIDRPFVAVLCFELP